ncbi:MAG: glycine cleavage system protein GcvH [Alphaproteobacteria bacterium]|nr:glycine cleavage system protein GcvH [Alphaproteobacteria bacterium]
MNDLKYTREHEWVRMEGDVAVIGISAFAQEALGDVVFVELPEIGKSLKAGDQAAVVESVKAASEVYAPLAGEVVGVNEALNDDPSTVNSDPTGKGWFLKMKPSNPADFEALMDEADYRKFAEEQG